MDATHHPKAAMVLKALECVFETRSHIATTECFNSFQKLFCLFSVSKSTSSSLTGSGATFADFEFNVSVQSKDKGQRLGFTSRSTARVILGQVFSTGTCGT